MNLNKVDSTKQQKFCYFEVKKYYRVQSVRGADFKAAFIFVLACQVL